MADLIADDPVMSVLYNAAPLGFVSEAFPEIEQVPGGLASGIRVHSHYSPAHVVSEPAFDFFSLEIRVLYTFPHSLSLDN